MFLYKYKQTKKPNARISFNAKYVKFSRFNINNNKYFIKQFDIFTHLL